MTFRLVDVLRRMQNTHNAAEFRVHVLCQLTSDRFQTVELTSCNGFAPTDGTWQSVGFDGEPVLRTVLFCTMPVRTDATAMVRTIAAHMNELGNFTDRAKQMIAEGTLALCILRPAWSETVYFTLQRFGRFDSPGIG